MVVSERDGTLPEGCDETDGGRLCQMGQVRERGAREAETGRAQEYNGTLHKPRLPYAANDDSGKVGTAYIIESIFARFFGPGTPNPSPRPPTQRASAAAVAHTVLNFKGPQRP